jgi:type II secretion system protein G
MKKISIFKIKLQISAGFTLIELLVVISIIGILSTFITANLLGARSRARDVQRKSDLRQLQSAFEIYRYDQSAYPASLPACGAVLGAGGSTYLQKVPCDPLKKSSYVYTTSGTSYALVTCLENINDPQKDVPNDAANCTGVSNWSYTLVNP